MNIFNTLSDVHYNSAINLKGTAGGILTERLKQSKPTNYSEIERLIHHLKPR
jgi:hypothetical protein